ncbi:MAG: DUF983 domain-containing protein [Actinobacteria bacterium]|nr:DUF983 domain-containing protein [Actinomycetota bacterium]MBV8960242.1 DUF983 domain-containing protein [Actinomycetota bacterium]MBV9663203.1 DUF983 domain-containing protein [Actinomycetota bacterium]MBV9933284.1 DUF983 domain-containing protein [Actinomycetota bacterium]
MRPPFGTMLKRGFLRHCPNCGGGHLFVHWLRMRERCPTCGIKFEREEGFFLGAFLINFGIGEGLIALLLFGYIILLSANKDVSIPAFIAAGIGMSIAATLFFYPFSKTIWSALDLAMKPLEDKELTDAMEHRLKHGDG